MSLRTTLVVLAVLAVVHGASDETIATGQAPLESYGEALKAGEKVDKSEATLKSQIKEHYDLLSPYYQDLWGAHIHHGLWRTGDETKEQAQENLVRELAVRARLTRGACKVLDVGCGVGGTSIMLARDYGCTVTGVTVSSTQVTMATENAAKAGVTVRFLEMNGEQLSFPGEDGSFDVVWISEALSHFHHKDSFFAHAHRLLKAKGRLVIADWFRAEGLNEQQTAEYITPIEFGMLLPRLDAMSDYVRHFYTTGFHLLFAEDVSAETARTWDLCLELIMDMSLWRMAYERGAEFYNFLKVFFNMRSGFASGAFRYALLVAERV